MIATDGEGAVVICAIHKAISKGTTCVRIGAAKCTNQAIGSNVLIDAIGTETQVCGTTIDVELHIVTCSNISEAGTGCITFVGNKDASGSDYSDLRSFG